MSRCSLNGTRISLLLFDPVRSLASNNQKQSVWLSWLERWSHSMTWPKVRDIQRSRVRASPPTVLFAFPSKSGLISFCHFTPSLVGFPAVSVPWESCISVCLFLPPSGWLGGVAICFPVSTPLSWYIYPASESACVELCNRS